MRLTSLGDRTRASFFFLPMVAVVVAIVAGTGLLALDDSIDELARGAPFVLGSTVDSARSVLSTIAAATISFAGIAFSVSLLVIQLSASQLSPRVVHTLFRDPFNKRVMALVLGTFTYCLVVLRSVRGPLEEGGEPVVPNVSLAIAVVLGVAAILATIAFINHSAHSMDISVLLERITDGALAQARRTRTLSTAGDGEPVGEPSAAELVGAPERVEGSVVVVPFRRNGWIQALDVDRLASLVPAGGSLVVLSAAGRYAIQGAPLCEVTGHPTAPADLADAVNDAVVLGNSRTMQQDATYGLRQLSDVALRALSTGVNDPTTAQDAIFHLAAVLTELLRRDPVPSVRITRQGGRLVFAEEPSHDDLVHAAFDEIRNAAAPHPAVCIYLLEALLLVRASLDGDGLSGRAPAIEEQARLVLDGSQRSAGLEHDREIVRRGYALRFGDGGPGHV